MVEAFFKQRGINHITGDVHYLAIGMSKRKTMLTVHDCGVLKGLKGIKLKLIKWFWFTWPARHCSWITVNSTFTKNDLLHYIRFDPEKIKVIYICIGDQYQPSPKEFNPDKPVILQIGTAENKNLKRVIAALKGINCRFVILGKINDEIKELLTACQLDYQIIEQALGDQELLQLYRSCDILSFVSTLEGFGMPIVEANAVGRVVMTSNLTAMPEIAGDAAHLVDPYDIEAIHKGFRLLIDSSEYRNQLIEKGYKNAKRFDKKVIAEQYFNLYRSIAS